MHYIDPGSGSMVFQLLLASVLGSIITFRKEVVGLFRRIFGRNT